MPTLSSDVSQPNPLLTTKLYLPPTRPDLVSRPRLIERLNQGLSCKLTLISAPAGYGKTTLVSEWLSGLDRPSAWLSLDEGDNDLARFLTYVIAALQHIDANLGQTTQTLIHTPQLPALEALLTPLINEIAALDTPFVLVLDDYHVITLPRVHEAMAFVLDKMPPQAHLVIATREDLPLSLARLRAQGQMTEIRGGDLRFTEGETAAFLNQTMGLNLPQEDIRALEIRTEGWIIGLQLAALSMQGEPPERIPDFIQAFTGSHRYIVDYLTEEVLRSRPPGTRSFLLETSVLDRLIGRLCDDVTGQRDGQATLERLEEANLFLIPLDNERGWYRYHHLFAELLHNQLVASHPELVPTLHRRASMWFESEGLLSEAVAHSIAAKDWQLAAQQILRTMIEMMARGENYTTLLRQLEALPDEIVRASPHLGIMYAYVLAIRIQLDRVEPRLQEIERIAGDQLTTELELQIKDVRAHAAVLQNNEERAFELSGEVLEALPEDRADDNPLQRQARMGMVFNFGHIYLFFKGNATKAQHWYAETLALCQDADSATLSLRAMMGLAQAQQLQGQLHRAYKTCQEGLQLARTTEKRYGQGLPATAWVQVVLGDLLREWNRLDEAADYLENCIELCRLWQVGDMLCASYLFQARVRLAGGDFAGAMDSIRQAEQLPKMYRDVPWTGGPTPACRAQVALAQVRAMARRPERENTFTAGGLGAVERWVEESGLSLDGAVSSLSQEFAYLIWARLLITRGQGGPALKLLARLRQAAENGDRTGRVIEVLVLKALALQTLGDLEQALLALQNALSLAELEGYVRLFVDEGPPMAALLSKILEAQRKGQKATARGIAPDYVGKLLAAFEIETKGDDRILAPARSAGVTEPSPSSFVLGPSSPALPAPVAPAHVSEAEGLAEPLSARELEVLRHLNTDLSAPEIAAELVVSVNTVRTHIKRIYSKLDAHSRYEAVQRAKELNLL
jgi:LuxR family maltose regulon positive regulatory protein